MLTMSNTFISKYLFYVLLLLIIISYMTMIIKGIYCKCNKNKESFEHNYVQEKGETTDHELVIDNVIANQLSLKNIDDYKRNVKFNINNCVFKGKSFNADSLYVGGKLTLRALSQELRTTFMDIVYPVGSIYINYLYNKNTGEYPDPNSLFPGTVWRKLEDCRYIYCIDKDATVDGQTVKPLDKIVEKQFDAYIYKKHLPKHYHNVTYLGKTAVTNSRHNHYVNDLSVKDAKYKKMHYRETLDETNNGRRMDWTDAETPDGFFCILLDDYKLNHWPVSFLPISQRADKLPDDYMDPDDVANNSVKRPELEEANSLLTYTTKNDQELDKSNIDLSKYIMLNNDSTSINKLYDYNDHLHKIPATTTGSLGGNTPYIPPRYHVICWIRIA